MLAGYPIYADLEAGYLNPINVLAVYLFGPYTSYKLLHWAAYAVGSVCFMLWLRKRLTAWPAVAVAQVIYYFSFAGLYHQQHFAITFGWYLFPCFIYLLELYSQTLKARYLTAYLLLLLYLMYFGAVQMVVISLLASGVYLAAIKGYTRALVTRAVLPCLLALCLLVPLGVTYAGQYTASARVATPEWWLEGSFDPQVVLSLVYPFPYRFSDAYMGVLVNRDYLMHEVYVYLGISGLCLAGLGLIVSKLAKSTNQMVLWFLTLFVVIGFAKANPLLGAVDPPILALFRYWGRLVLLATFALSVYCGHFIDQLTQVPRQLVINKSATRWLAAIVVYLAALELSALPNSSLVGLARLWLRPDFHFDYLYAYLGFLAAFVVMLTLTLTVTKFPWLKYALFVLPVVELAVFGQLVLKDAFVSTDQLATALPAIETTYTNRRIIVTNADVIGNKTLYYTFWSPFGYVSSANMAYDEALTDLGFESARRPVLAAALQGQGGFANARLHTGVQTMGIAAIVDSQANPIFVNPTSAMFYPVESDGAITVQELARAEDRYTLQVVARQAGTIASYVRYDPGWKVAVNGIPTPVTNSDLGLRFAVPAGSSTVAVRYIPHILYLGVAVALLAMSGCMVLAVLVRKRPRVGVLLALMVLFLALRLPGLGWDMVNSDGARWHRRSERFLQALKQGDLSATYQHYQPGVTLMWLNAATTKVIWEVQDAFTLPRWSLEHAQDFPSSDAVAKTVVVSVLACVFLYQLQILVKLASLKVAVLYGVLVAAEPYLIGIDRWFHLTSLESYFAFSAFLTYLYYAHTHRRRTLVAAGALAALAALSKLTALTALPLMAGIELVTGYRAKTLKKSLGALAILFGSFGVVSFALFPALWVDLPTVVHNLVSAVVAAVDSDTRARYFFPPFSYIYYLVILGYKLTPVSVLLFGIAVAALVRQMLRKQSPRGTLVLAYALTFFLVLTISTKKIDRYSLALVQPILLVIALYLASLNRKLVALIFAVHLAVAGFSYAKHFPVPSSYYSPLLGGSTAALRLGVYENSGEYFAQAAKYLTAQGRWDVYVPDNYESFSYYYHGKTLRDYASSARYVVTSVDFDRPTPRLIPGCTTLTKTFGPVDSSPWVYIYACTT
jgi:hypothetical protein